MNKEEITFEIPKDQVVISEEKDDECLIWINTKAIHMADKIDRLSQENKQLQERIDKAIEYIEKRYNYEDNVLIHTFDKDNIKELYEILKGVNDD